MYHIILVLLLNVSITDPTSSFGVFRQSEQFLFHILLFTSLHVSASVGHPQAKYTQSFFKAIKPTMDPFLGYTVHYFKLYYVIYYN
jgi:hypothetical protein